ncbi:Folylpolyglutamate synthetase [Pseudogymnoascus verrucosus]|uniref:Folylpolyglutamate synthase n=1 Tax=Pseudogymnoascus verrucosus TaxID=342668 RepID=A0A1B8GRL9_9PEZI|nr:Folylpolyglutamate synthetase [Pseudogymnoascus verrucosus]OBT98475.2 Folylpolyglutamate synthetase [Pseudogymnoascus verrucosus]
MIRPTLLPPRLIRSLQQFHYSTKSPTKMAPKPVRTYKQALSLLNELQSNQAVVSMVSSSSANANSLAIPEMLDWLRKLTYTPASFNDLRVIHVAGTKGKGSVCAMLDSMLKQYLLTQNASGVTEGRKPLGRVGVFTSPHLITPRERIRLDGLPISKELFTQRFFEVWDKYTAFALEDNHPNPEGAESKPGYFRFLTILALHTFLKENVQTAIIECGIGGEYDSTNILPKEAKTATVITRLGIDHVGMLGDTLGEIAWNKAGIMRPGVPCFTVRQPEDAMKVLQERAAETGTELTVVKRIPEFDNNELKLSLEGDFQKDNASLAIAALTSHLKTLGIAAIPETTTPPEIQRGLSSISWPGRCQVIHENNIDWLIDGAHTDDSLAEVARWFAGKWDAEAHQPAVLIFNSQLRDAPRLAGKLRESLGEATGGGRDVFCKAGFSTNIPFKKDVPNPSIDTLQRETAEAWVRGGGSGVPAVYDSIEAAISGAREVAKARHPEKVHVLVTGSLHLVGGFLKAMGAESE